MFKRVLISNRGEIAIRIARTATAIGVESLGVYTASDALSLHPQFTTMRAEIGEADDSVAASHNHWAANMSASFSC